MEANQIDESFIEQLQAKMKIYFEQKGVITTKEEFNPFLEEVGLWEIWDSNDEKEAIWETLMNYKNSENSIDYEAAINGLNELLNVDEEESEDKKSNEYSNIFISTQEEEETPTVPKKRAEQRQVTKRFCEIEIDNVIQLRKIFILLELKDKPEISITEIKELLKKHNFITLSFDKVFSFIKEIGVELENDKEGNKEKIIIDKDYYHRAFLAIEAKVRAYTEEQEKKNINDLVIGFDKNYIVTDSYDPNAINNIMDLIQDITAHEQESLDYTTILKETKGTLIDLTSNFSLVFDKLQSLISSDDQTIWIKSRNSLENKLEHYENITNEIIQFSHLKLKQIETLRKSCLTFDNNFTLVKEQITQLYQKYHSNFKVEMDDEMERLLDENIIWSRDKEEKTWKIKNMEKENFELEKAIHEWNLKEMESEREKELLNQQVNILQREKEWLKQEYNNTIDKVLVKINEDEKHRLEAETREKTLSAKTCTVEGIRRCNTINGKGLESQKKMNSKEENLSISMIEEAWKKRHSFSTLTYEKLWSYTLKIDMDNQHLSMSSNGYENKINAWERELNEVKEAHKKDMLKIDILNKVNNRWQSKICELWRDVEINNKFRPTSTIINNVKRNRQSQFKNCSNSFTRATPEMKAKKFDVLKYKKPGKTSTIKGDYQKLNKLFLQKKWKLASIFKGKTDSTTTEEKSKRFNFCLNKVNDQEHLQPIEEGNWSERSLKLNKESISIIEHEGYDVNDIGDTVNFEKEFNPNFGVDVHKLNWFENIELTEHCDHQVPKCPTSMMNLSPKLDVQSQNTSHDYDNDISNENDMNWSSNASFFSHKRNSLIPNSTNSSVDSYDPKLWKKRLSIPCALYSSTIEECILGFNKKEKKVQTPRFKKSKSIQKSHFRKNKSEATETENKENQTPIGITKRIKDCYSHEIQYYNLEDSESIHNAIKNAMITPKSPEPKKILHSKSLKMSQKYSNFLSDSVIIEEDEYNPNDKEKEKEKENSWWTLSNQVPWTETNIIDIPGQIEKKDDFFPSFNIINSKHTRCKTTEFCLKSAPKKNYDFLSLHKNPLIQKILKTKNDNTWPKDIYTDCIWKIVNNKGVKYNIIITQNAIYLLSVTNLTLVQFISKDTLEKVTIPYNNHNFIAIHIQDSKDDLLISSLRRLKMWEYLKEYYREKNSIILKFKFSNSFNFKINGVPTEIQVNQIPTIHSNLDGAKKFGYLYKLTNGIFKNSFSEYLVAWTDIGLMVFSELNKPPVNLIPIIGSRISIISDTKYSRQNVFEIVNNNGYYDIFSANSKEELDSWYTALIYVQNKYQNKLTKLDKASKKCE